MILCRIDAWQLQVIWLFFGLYALKMKIKLVMVFLLYYDDVLFDIQWSFVICQYGSSVTPPLLHTHTHEHMGKKGTLI